jgi:hypothetical protein
LPSDRVRAVPLAPRLARRLGDCNAYDRLTPKEAGLSAVVKGQGRGATLRLAAFVHTACISIPLRGVSPAAPFRLRLAYRDVGGNVPRLCIWESGPNHCATAPSLVSSPGWHRFEATVRLARGTRSSRLFLYADGGASESTVTEYRDLTTEIPQSAIAVGASPVAPLPRVEYDRVAPYEFRVHVEDARRPFLLVLGETLASGWRLEGGGETSARPTHLRVNGYANGWRVARRGSYDLKLTYAPEQFAIWARVGDAAFIPAALAFSLLGWAVRSRRLRVNVPWQEPRRARPLPTTLAAGPRPENELTSDVQQRPSAVEPTPADGAELGVRVEQTSTQLASDIEALRRSTEEMRESMRSLFLDALRPLEGDLRAKSEDEPVDELTSRTLGRDEPSKTEPE